MNVLDENIIASQCGKLRRWRVPFRQIGIEVGRKGMDDVEHIIPLLHRLHLPTLFTRDAGFYDRALCHSGYCIVSLSVSKDEAADYIRRFLRHPRFRTRAKRMGYIVRVSTAGMSLWRKNERREETAYWHS